LGIDILHKTLRCVRTRLYHFSKTNAPKKIRWLLSINQVIISLNPIWSIDVIFWYVWYV